MVSTKLTLALQLTLQSHRNQGNVSSITMLLAGQSRAQIQTWREDFSFLQNIQTSSGDHPASYSMGTVVLSQGYSSWSTKIKNTWSYTSTPPICLHCMDTDNFYFSNVQFSAKWSIKELQLFGWFLGLQKSFSVVNNKSASMCLTSVPLHIYTSVRNPWCTITITTFTHQNGAVPHAVV